MRKASEILATALNLLSQVCESETSRRFYMRRRSNANLEQ